MHRQVRMGKARDGFAMVAVLLVLMALFVLCAPFLLTVRNADRASAQAADRTAARLALDSAQRHARARLTGSHPSLDRTPYFDDQDELDVRADLPKEFLDAGDASGVMWDLDVEDDAGRVDLGSASPGVLANLLGAVARLSQEVTDQDTAFPVASGAGLGTSGVAWVDNELVRWAEHPAGALVKLERGLGVLRDADGAPLPCGPRPASEHDLGAYVIDQVAFALPQWRIRSQPEAGFRVPDAIEQTARAVQFSLTDALPSDFLDVLERTASAQGGVGAGPQWMHAVTVTGPISGEPGGGCLLPVDDARNFNAWTTVRITDGEVTEYGLVRAANRDRIRLVGPLGYDGFEPFRTVVAPLARRPVNVNTASPEVLRALFLNLKLRGKSSRITEREADDLVEVVVTSRPFEGFEDFLRRVVLPAGGFEELPADAPVVPELLRPDTSAEEGAAPPSFLDPDDARALYKNAVNASDIDLEFSTMPLCFTSRDVYRLDLRAAVNASSGVERARAHREEVDLVAPQQELLRLWSRQEDFDTEPLYDGEAPYWLSGPEATSRADRVFGSPWPPRARAHLGPYALRPQLDPAPPPLEEGQEPPEPALTFPSREDGTGWIQLAPAREPDVPGGVRTLHFDDETESLEGHDLATGALRGSPGQYGIAGGNLDPFTFRGWIRPRAFVEGDRYLDLGGNFTDSDRLSLGIEGGDLVLRVLDAMGDHPATDFHEAAEVRYSLTDPPGLSADEWFHVDVQAGGSRPDQLHLFVDGRDDARTLGLTRLTASVSSAATTIPVESTEGFPPRSVLRIGDELIEAIVDGKTSFRCVHESTGPNAGFGGRLARERYSVAPEQNLGVQTKDTDYPRGTAVELYGYSLPLLTNVPSSSGRLPRELGGYAVARVEALVRNGGEDNDPITASDPQVPGVVYQIGEGLSGATNAGIALRLAPADPGRDPAEVMAAFDPSGGYAAILSRVYAFDTEPTRNVPTGEVAGDSGSYRIGGVEVVRYASVSGNDLLIAGRGVGAPELRSLPATTRVGPGSADVVGRSSFIFDWSKSNLTNAQQRADDLTEQTFVIPISVNVGTTTAFNAPSGDSEFAQITRLGTDAGQTEWVRYDDIAAGGFLVRSDPDALWQANDAAHGGVRKGEGTLSRPGGGPGSGSGVPGGPRLDLSLAPGASAPAPERPARPASQGGNAFWHYALGEPEFEVEANPVTRAVASRFQFRGVLGTYSHQHPAGTPVLPVFQLNDQDETAGYPGRFDRVALLDQDPATPAFHATVMHAYRPLEHAVYGYLRGSGGALDAADSGTEVAEPEVGMRTNVIYVALEEALAVPFAPSRLQGVITDTRVVSRMIKFPSGELPRGVTALAIGGDVKTPRAAVPAAVVDELSFGLANPRDQFILKSGNPGGPDTPLSESGDSFEVWEAVRTLGGDLASARPLNALPQDGGLLRIGDEVLGYDSYDAESNTVHVAPGGRGMLGSDAGAHAAGEAITFLSTWTATTLARGLSASGSELTLTSPDGFPDAGLVRIDDELVHFTDLRGGVLRMPRASERPGERDRKGEALFRGRFGTRPSTHGPGTLVLLHPFRYWDRAAPRADDPELAYFQFDLDQPGAFWRSVFWDDEQPGSGGVHLEVLERTDPSVPWDSDPDTTKGLRLLTRGRIASGGNPIARQSDRVQWRVFVRYEEGAFDPIAGLSHGWKTTPRVRQFGALYLAPSHVLRRVER